MPNDLPDSIISRLVLSVERATNALVATAEATERIATAMETVAQTSVMRAEGAMGLAEAIRAKHGSPTEPERLPWEREP